MGTPGLGDSSAWYQKSKLRKAAVPAAFSRSNQPFRTGLRCCRMQTEGSLDCVEVCHTTQLRRHSERSLRWDLLSEKEFKPW
jgi:hypothetical protein